jgi:hypothetical protein
MIAKLFFQGLEKTIRPYPSTRKPRKTVRRFFQTSVPGSSTSDTTVISIVELLQWKLSPGRELCCEVAEELIVVLRKVGIALEKLISEHEKIEVNQRRITAFLDRVTRDVKFDGARVCG